MLDPNRIRGIIDYDLGHYQNIVQAELLPDQIEREIAEETTEDEIEREEDNG